MENPGKIFLNEAIIIAGTALTGYFIFLLYPAVISLPIYTVCLVMLMSTTLYIDKIVFTIQYNVQAIRNAMIQSLPGILIASIGAFLTDIVCITRHVSNARYKVHCHLDQFGEEFHWFLVHLIGISVFRVCSAGITLFYQIAIQILRLCFDLELDDKA